MSAEEMLLERLEAVLARLDAPAVPLDAQLWDLATAAKYLQRNTEVVRATMACLPSFPKAVRLPCRGKRGYALYYASEVIEWARTFRDKR